MIFSNQPRMATTAPKVPYIDELFQVGSYNYS